MRITPSRLAQAFGVIVIGIALVGCGDDDGDQLVIIDDPAPDSTVLCTITELNALIFGTYPVGIVLYDFPASTISYTPQFSTDGGVTWLTATAGLGGDPTTGLQATPFGETYTFAWDTIVDLPLSFGAAIDDVIFRVLPAGGTACRSNAVRVLNAPIHLDIADITTGMGQLDVPVPVTLTNVVPYSGPADIEFSVTYDPLLVTLVGASPGVDAPALTTATMTSTGTGVGRVQVTSPGSSYPDGIIVNLLFDTVCAPPATLPATSMVTCSNPEARDLNGNSVAIDCGLDGSVRLERNDLVIDLPDFALTIGQATGDVPVNVVNWAPSVQADHVAFTATWDPAQISIVGASAGSALAPAAIVGFTPGAAGTATIDVSNPAGTPILDGVIILFQIDVLGTTPTLTTIDLGALVVESEACVGLPGSFANDPVDVQIQIERELLDLHVVSAIGSRGTPSQVPGSVDNGTPRGNFTPLNEGEFNSTISFATGGNPVLFFSLGDPGFPLVLEASWTTAPLISNVAAAMTPDGSTDYNVTSAGTYVGISANGVLTPLAGNGCDTFTALFTPNGISTTGAPRMLTFAACVDLGGIDETTRTANLPIGNIDADIPGMPVGDPAPGVGGLFGVPIYANAGGGTIGAYQIFTAWDATILQLATGVGTSGYSMPSEPLLGGPTIVNSSIPGQSDANHFTLSTVGTGVFDIWTMNFIVLASGASPIQHTVVTMGSASVPPVRVGDPTPRPAIEASASAVVFP